MDLCRIIEKKNVFIDCSPCDLSSSCNITGPLKNLNSAIIDFFESLTLQQLLEETSLVSKTINFNKEMSL